MNHHKTTEQEFEAKALRALAAGMPDAKVETAMRALGCYDRGLVVTLPTGQQFLFKVITLESDDE